MQFGTLHATFLQIATDNEYIESQSATLGSDSCTKNVQETSHL